MEVQEKRSFLAMYDVRGIQNYIFRTNKMQEIIGASRLVENIIIEGLDNIIENNQWNKELYLTHWEEDEPDAFLGREAVRMQVLFIGGGNAYVLFREEETLRRVNRALARYVLEETYSLNLAVAVVEKTEDYKKDYDEIQQRMREIKSRMPETKPTGAMPFMSTDSITGYPLTQKIWLDKDKAEYVCTESALKRNRFNTSEKKERGEDRSDMEIARNAEKILDNMVTEKGDSSHLAVVHIDGNNMGARIRAIMEKEHDYGKAITTMRMISRNIRCSFQDTFNEMGRAIDAVSDQIKPDRKGRLHRRIVVAGDDITFVCNARAAIYAVDVFLKSIGNKTMFWEENISGEENRRRYSFSACAGIAYFNSHFPFRDAYEVAEECCSNAKSMAKSRENRDGGTAEGNIGSYFDYQICSTIRAADLKDYRMKHYLTPDKSSILQRPYYVPCQAYEGIMDLNSRNDRRSIKILWKCLQFFQEGDESGNMTRSRAKKLRNAFALGKDEVEKYYTFLLSRDVAFPDDMPEKCFWYDALEIMDFCLVVDTGRNEEDEQNREVHREADNVGEGRMEG